MEDNKTQTNTLVVTNLADLDARTVDLIAQGIVKALPEIKKLLGQIETPSDRLLSYPEAMQLLNITSRTALHNYCRKGLLTPTRIGKKLFFSEKQIQQALKVN